VLSALPVIHHAGEELLAADPLAANALLYAHDSVSPN